MFNFLKLLLVIALVNTPCLFASPCPGNWNLSASYLYFLPSVDDTYFVLDAPQASAVPNGTRKDNPFGFHSGFRVEGAYGLCEGERSIKASYSRLCAQQSRIVSGNFLWATVGAGGFFFGNFNGSASADSKILYQQVDAILEQQLFCWCQTKLNFLAGLEYAYIHLRETFLYQRIGPVSSERFNQNSKVWGLGPKVGFNLDYSLCQLSWVCPGNLSLTSAFSGSILASRTETSTFDQVILAVPQAPTDINDVPVWRLIPAFHASVGLNYETCLSFGIASLEIGYEFNFYLRGINRHAPVVFAFNNQVSTNYFNFSTQGLYIQGSISF